MSGDPLYLPDDLEERWPIMGLQQHIIRQHWRENVHRMTWQQRRRISKIIGGPITSGGSLPLDDDPEVEKVRAIGAYILARHGQDGFKLICKTADKAGVNRHGAAYSDLLKWATDLYERGEVLA